MFCSFLISSSKLCIYRKKWSSFNWLKTMHTWLTFDLHLQHLNMRLEVHPKESINILSHPTVDHQCGIQQKLLSIQHMNCFLYKNPLDWVTTSPPLIKQAYLCWKSLPSSSHLHPYVSRHTCVGPPYSSHLHPYVSKHTCVGTLSPSHLHT